MGVYIKGMKMPKDCRECPFEGYHANIGKTYCMACLKVLATAFKPISFDGKSKWCPLVEVPEPHGRLIDVNDAKSRMIPLSFSVQKWIGEVELSNCKTVIEAEDE